MKIALVIGGTSGFGRATVNLFRSSDFDVWSAGRRTTHPIDVRDQTSVDSFFRYFAGWHLDAVVYSAGIARGLRKVVDGVPTDWQNVFETNTIGLLRVARAALPLLEKNKGTFVHIGSIAYELQYEGGVDYCASKAASTSIMKGLRLEALGTGIRISSIEPGLGDTDFQVRRYDGDKEKAAKHYGTITALDPLDVARAVLFIVTQPNHVNIDQLIIKPTDQATHGKTAKKEPK